MMHLYTGGPPIMTVLALHMYVQDVVVPALQPRLVLVQYRSGSAPDTVVPAVGKLHP